MADYILLQTRQNISFLVSQKAIAQSDADAILSMLPDQNSAMTSPSSGAPTPNSYLRPQTVQLARAIWGYNEDRQNPDDLSFRPGDILEIVIETNPDWWTGKWEGRTGLFPSNYVEKIPAPVASSEGEREQSSGLDQAPMYPGPTPGGPYGQMQMQPHAAYQQLPNPHGSPQDCNSYEKYSSPLAPQQLPSPPVLMQQPPTKSSFRSKYGNTLAHSAVGGVGFGAGSAIGSGIVNSIF